MKVVVITGGTAGVGRATAEAFARLGWRIGILARDKARLDEARADLMALGAPDVEVFSADVADAGAVNDAADHFETRLGAIDVWVNNVMTTVFGSLDQMTDAEFRRVTDVTYLGQVYGTMAALRLMRPRGRGAIIQVGSALSYRSVPLQSAYCGAKHAIKGFTDSVRSELIHDGVGISLSLIYLPALNTPQFGWARNKMPQRPHPAAPIYRPEAAARAVVFAAQHPRREIWVGKSTLQLAALDFAAPGLTDRLMATKAYSGQMSGETETGDRSGNLFEPVAGKSSAAGRWGREAQAGTGEMWTSRQREALVGGIAGLALLGVASVTRLAVGIIRGR